MSKLRAILVAVDYTDLLALTLPYNRHHFSEVMVVTSHRCALDVDRVCVGKNTQVYATDAFYDDGAVFNKWKALEEGLDVFGRHGWLCLMDADVLWPKSISLCTCPCHSGIGGMRHFRACCESMCGLVRGILYSPLRRMYPRVQGLTPTTLPPEDTWAHYPIHRNLAEWAGYTQIFHAEDPVLGPAPWHETNWKHAGGADSFFQRKWDPENKVRPPFEVLHLGPAGENWCGRATEDVEGKVRADAGLRRQQVRDFIRSRRHDLDDPYREEKI